MSFENNDQGRGLREACEKQVQKPLQTCVSAEKLVSRAAEGRADDLAYIERVGLETIRRHAEDFVREKLSPAEPVNDGKQPPMRNAPKNEVRREGREATRKRPRT